MDNKWAQNKRILNNSHLMSTHQFSDPGYLISISGSVIALSQRSFPPLPTAAARDHVAAAAAMLLANRELIRIGMCQLGVYAKAAAAA